MRKIARVTVALLAVFAFGAVIASAAFAENTLPANWLANGNAVAAELGTESKGELLLEDQGAGGAAVLCEGILVGTVNAAGADLTNEVLNVAGEKIELGLRALLGTGAALPDCVTVKVCAQGTAASPIEVWPEGLPWTTKLVLDETTEKFLDIITGAEVGYLLLCLVAGINIEDKCVSTSLSIEVVNNAGGDAAVPAGAETLPLANCSIGGTEKGLNKADAEAPILLTGTSAGELLTVSE